MKQYSKPTLCVYNVQNKNIILTSTPGVNNQDADPNQPAMAPQKGADWQNW